MDRRYVVTMTGELRAYGPCPGCRPIPPRLIGDPTSGDPAYQVRYASCGQIHETTVACPDCGATVLYTLTWADTDEHLRATCVCGTTWTTPVTPAQWDAGTDRPQIPDYPPDR